MNNNENSNKIKNTSTALNDIALSIGVIKNSLTSISGNIEKLSDSIGTLVSAQKQKEHAGVT